MMKRLRRIFYERLIRFTVEIVWIDEQMDFHSEFLEIIKIDDTNWENKELSKDRGIFDKEMEKVWSYARRVIPIAAEVGRETTLCAQRPVRIHTRPHQVRHKDDPPSPAQRCPMNPFRVFPPRPTPFLILQGIGEILASPGTRHMA